MYKFLVLILILSVNKNLFAQSMPTNFKVTNCNGYVRLTWINGDTFYTKTYIYRDNEYWGQVASGENSKNIFELRHSKHSYYLKAYRSGGFFSQATPSLEGFSIRTVKIADNNGEGIMDIGNFQSSNNGDGWKDFNFDDDPFSLLDIGFFLGDSIIICNTVTQNNNIKATIILPETDDFPKVVYSGQTDNLLFISNDLVTGNINDKAIFSPPYGLHGFYISGPNNITIKGCKFNGTSGDLGANIDGTYAITIINSKNSIIENNEFNFTSGEGCIKMQVDGQDVINNYIRYNTVIQSTASANFMGGSPSTIPTHETTWGWNGDFLQCGKESNNSSGLFDDINIYSNYITMQNSVTTGCTTSTYVPVPHTDMIQLYRLNTGTTINIYKNYFKWVGTRCDEGIQGIHATSTNDGTLGHEGQGGTEGEVRLWNNVFYFNTATKMININNNTYEVITNTTPPIYNSDGKIRLFAYNNTMYLSGINTDVNPMIIIDKPFNMSTKRNDIVNNIFYKSNITYLNGKVDIWNFRNVAYDITSSIDYIDDNLYYSTAAGNYLSWNTVRYTQLSLALLTTTVIENNGAEGNPLFSEDPPDGNNPYDLIGTSATYVIDKGIDLFPILNSYDDFCNPPHDRSILWCRGAFEDADNTGEVPGMQKINSEFIKKNLLTQNYPNPFNPTTTISYSLPANGFTTLKIYDILGNEVATLVNEEKIAGNYVIDFNASNLSSGVYFYSLTSGDFTMNKKMILMK